MDIKCEGCSEEKGEPFWGECETYSCTGERGVEHCGECHDFPCVDFMERYDPHIGPVHSVQRAGILAYREKYGLTKESRSIHMRWKRRYLEKNSRNFQIN